MYSLFRSLLFRLDPETAHRLTLHAIRMAGNFPLSNWLLTQLYKTPSKPVQAFGLTFKNPVGLAAGYDKDAVAIKGLAALGLDIWRWERSRPSLSLGTRVRACSAFWR